MSESKVKPCQCEHPAQDKMYGKGMRVHNFAPKANKNQGAWRCTVCKLEKPV